MKIDSKFSALALVAACAAPFCLQAQTVAWGTSANINPMSFTSNGSVDNLTWDLGWFEDGFTPNASNAGLWGANWNPVASSQYTNFGGFYAVSVNTSDVGAAAAGKQMYVFAYNDLNRLDSPQGEALIFFQPGQQFPDTPNFETLDVEDNPFDPGDDDFVVVWGQVDRDVDTVGVGLVSGDGEASDKKVESTDPRPFATFETQSFTWMIRDETIFVATPEALMGSPFGRLPTLEQRVGERIWLHRLSDSATEGGRRAIVPPSLSTDGELTVPEAGPTLLANPLLDAAWVRVIYDRVDGNIGGGRSFESDYIGLQVGFDLARKRQETGLWIFALTAQLATLSADAQGPSGYGSLDTEGYGFGATATWHGDDGTYIDLQSQYNFLENDYSTRGDSNFADAQDIDILALSIEIGRRHVFREKKAYRRYANRREHLPEPEARQWAPGESWGFTPQAQLQWSRMSSQSFSDSRGNNPVEIKAQEQLLGRLGWAIDYRIGDGSNEAMRKIYGIANLLHRFTGDSEVVHSGQRFTAESEQTWGEIGLGGSIDWYNEAEDRLFKLYGEFAYRRAAGSSGSDGVHLTLGVRKAW